MIRCYSKFVFPLQTRVCTLVCPNRLHAAPSFRKGFTQRRYASTEDCKTPLIPRRVKRFFYTSAGLTIIGVGGVVVYAKQDPKFREFVETYVPGSDRFFGFVYQETVNLSLEGIKDTILNLPNEIYKKSTDALENVTKSAKQDTPDSRTDKPIKKQPSGTDKPIEKDTQQTVSQKTSEAKVKPVEGGKLEITVLKTGEEAVALYKDAIKLLEGKQNNIPDLIDKAVEDNDLKLWNDIRKQIAEQNETSGEVEHIEKQAEDLRKKYLSEKKSLISKVKINEQSIKQLNSTEDKLSELKSKFQAMKVLKLEGAKNYFNKVEEGRKHFLEELNILFPNIRLSDSQPKLNESDVDLFLYYAVQKLNYYQKEIAKLEAQALDRLKKLVQANPSLQDSIDSEVSKARRQIKEEFDKKMLDLKSTCEKQLHEQLKRQEQVHLDLLNDQLKLKEQEVERKLLQRVEAQVEEERSRLTEELAEMSARMKALNEAISKRVLQDMKAHTSQALWGAAESLHNKLKRSSEQTAEEPTPQPLASDVEAIRRAAAKGDDLVETVLATIPKTARDRGVYPEDALRERFLKVESAAWRVAIVPEGGTSLPMLLLAWIQSAFIIRAFEPIPSSELKNEPIDPCSLDNYDILQRARYWVDRGDFEQALRYMNLLRGGARSLSLDWMKEVTLLLEAQQAANLLLAHASASAMIYS